jgi:Tol biopolymer transport system component/DNA-binding winged helix-turn-helix (wHTH) protein
VTRRTARYEFGAYHLDPLARVLSVRDRPIALAPKSFDLLLLLVQGAGRVVTREELISALWPDTIVEEANLTFQISTLRKALAEDGSKWIETVPKHGYRFTAPVREILPEEPPQTTTAPPALAPTPTPTPMPTPTRTRAGVAAWLLLAVVACGGAAGWWWWRQRQSPGAPSGASMGMVAVPLTSYRGWEGSPTLSPDGSQVAFAWDGPGQDNLDIYLKLVGPGEPHRLTTDPAADFSPAWSPDGDRIAFLRQFDEEGRCAIYLMPALGGRERRLADVDLTAFRSAPGSLLAWTPDGRWLAVAGRFHEGDPSEVWLLSPETGDRRRLTTVGEGQIGDFGIAFSPDGRLLALLRFSTRSVGDVYLLPLGADATVNGPLVRLTHENRLMGGPSWSARGDRLFYSTGGALGYRTLRVLPIDPAHPERPVDSMPFPAGEHATTLAAARNRLVYAREERDTNIWRLPLRGTATHETPAMLIASTFDEYNPDFSADGQRLTFTSTRSGTEEIWIANADGSAATQMTSVGGANTSNSRWSPDGQSLVYNSRRSGSSDLYLLDVSTRATRRLTDDPTDEYEPRWSRDGHWIYFVSTRSGRREVWKIPAAGGPAAQVTRRGGGAAFESPDRRWIYYAKDTRPSSIWRVPVDGGDETQVFEGLSFDVNFAVGANGLYVIAVHGAAASIELFDLTTRRRTSLHTLDRPVWFGFAVSPDERAILFSQVDSRTGDLMLVENVR